MRQNNLSIPYKRYVAILHTETHAENSEMYQGAGKTIDGIDEYGHYCQVIFV